MKSVQFIVILCIVLEFTLLTRFVDDCFVVIFSDRPRHRLQGHREAHEQKGGGR